MVGCWVVDDTLLGPEGPGAAALVAGPLFVWGCLWGWWWWFLVDVVAARIPARVLASVGGVGVGVCGVGGGVGRLFVENFTVDASIFVFACVFKFLRAHGGCLGTRNRRRTWESAICLGESITRL